MFSVSYVAKFDNYNLTADVIEVMTHFSFLWYSIMGDEVLGELNLRSFGSGFITRSWQK